MAMDLATGNTREIAPDWDRSADGIALNAEGTKIYTTAYDVGTHDLFAIDIASGEATMVVEGGTVGGFDLVGDTLAYTRDSLTAPAQAFVSRADGSAPRQVTVNNQDLLSGIAMGEAEQFSFKGWNDETVYGWVVKPANYVEGKQYPVAFLIHGGPQGSFGDNFHYRWNAQTYAGQGFAVVMIDFHGSTGYGQAFTDAISQHWGDRPLEDLQRGWAAAQQKYSFLDGDRACALGGSYGGYMVSWIAGNWPDAFRCLVNHAGVFDTRLMGVNTEELWFSEWENGGTVWDVPENYERFNPLNHVSKWQAPLLVIHGEKDYRVLVEQGLAAFSAAQRRGIESRLLRFPDENHWILKPHNSVLWHDTVNDWLKRWTAE
jgi:dipeptidyl aminopeptidase/acylaminoacyl peptidase